VIGSGRGPGGTGGSGGTGMGPGGPGSGWGSGGSGNGSGVGVAPGAGLSTVASRALIPARYPARAGLNRRPPALGAGDGGATEGRGAVASAATGRSGPIVGEPPEADDQLVIDDGACHDAASCTVIMGETR
jgi:hypothetical protein